MTAFFYGKLQKSNYKIGSDSLSWILTGTK